MLWYWFWKDVQTSYSLSLNCTANTNKTTSKRSCRCAQQQGNSQLVSYLYVMSRITTRNILGVSRLDKIRNTTIRKSLDLKKKFIERISQKRFRYYGHIMRMNTQRMPYIILNGMVQGNRQRGRQVKRWLDGIRNAVEKLNLTEASRKTQSKETWKEVMQRIASLNLVGADAIKKKNILWPNMISRGMSQHNLMIKADICLNRRGMIVAIIVAVSYNFQERTSCKRVNSFS